MTRTFRRFISPLLLAGLYLIAVVSPLRADVAVVKDGVTCVAIHVAPDVMATDKPLAANAPFRERNAQEQRHRLRESVNDLALYLQKMSGTSVGVLQHIPAANDRQTPVLIGEYAAQKFGALKMKTPFQQGFRVVVTPTAIGLYGESDEATSYAIYEVLDRLGCRWFMPGPYGEVIPEMKNIALPEMDFSGAPGTSYRGIWYADDNYKRRNRLGGFLLQAGHALEAYITKEQRAAHPEWVGIVNGKPDAVRLKWSAPGVADAVADAIIARLDKSYQPSISLSPEDGASFDESDDKKWDAGDYDPSLNMISITDRLIKFANLVAARVNKKYPDVQFGLLAYGPSSRPPIHEKPLPNVIPQIAPITYCRAHAMTDTALCPSRPQIRPIIEGWAKVAPRLSYYNYMFQLAEVSVPYPMMHQMKAELPILYANHVDFWQPETIPNFDSALPGLWLTIRKAWNPQANSDAILNDLFTRFYGAASTPMRRYWQIFDDAWTNVPEHAGSGWGHMRRFTPEVMKAARAAMDEALAAAATPAEYYRVKLHDESLRQFERFMQLRWDLAEGRLKNMQWRNRAWIGTQIGLGDEYSANYAFTQARWTPRTVAGGYFWNWFGQTYEDAGAIADNDILISSPLRTWKYQVAEKQDGEALGWQSENFDDAAWKTTDPIVDTWYDLGLENYYGAVWYRQSAKIPAVPVGKKIYLWVPSEDGDIKLFANGRHVPYIDAKGESHEYFTGYGVPASFDITAFAKPNATNQFTIVGTRNFLNELGAGGLMGPVYLYREK